MLVNKTELMVEINGVKHFLDLKEDAQFTLIYNINDINNIDNSNSSYSKTIVLPETDNNISILEHISYVNSSTSFDPNKKMNAWLFVDSIPTFVGYLQIKSINKNIFTDLNEIEVVLLADNGKLFKNIGEKFLTDLNFSELNHNWDKHNVHKSFTHKWNDGYFYPLIDYGYNWTLNDINGSNNDWNNQVRVTDMYPSTNVKYIVDKIFSDNGFRYKSDFFESVMFKNLYIPFNGSDIYRDSNSLYDKFRIGMTTPVSISTGSNINIRPDKSYSVGSGTLTNIEDDITLGTFRIPFNNENAPNGDPYNLYDNLNYEYTAPSNFPSSRFVCDFDLEFELSIDVDKYSVISIPMNNICFKRSRNPLTGVTVSGGVVIPINGNNAPVSFKNSDIPGIEYFDYENGNNVGLTSIANGYTYNVNIQKGPKRVKGQISTDILDGSTPNRTKLYPGEKVWVEVTLSSTNQQIRTQFGNYTLDLPQVTVPNAGMYRTTLFSGRKLMTVNVGTQLFNVLSDKVGLGEMIDYNKIIPVNIKQKDFLKGIINMFNLVMEPDLNDKGFIVIEPRDDFYGKGTYKDWTDKIDISQNVTMQILAETQNKILNFRYKDDSDFYNVNYKDAHGGMNYGELKHIIDNDFNKGEKKVEVIFSPTPIVNLNGSVQFVIPKIGKLNNNVFSKTDHNIRILTRFTSSTDKIWKYDDYVWYVNVNSQWNGYISLTTNGFTNVAHPGYKVGDYINVNQVDGGSLKPMLQGNFKIVEVPDNRTIVIDIPANQVGSGIAIQGTITPLDGMLPCSKDLDAWNFDGTKLKAYPYLGHFDNPQEPSYDLNFGQTNGLWYQQEVVTNNNLYNNYWKNTCDELSSKDSRLITAYFRLDVNDISSFSFRDNIFIRDSYYKVNKISDYNPTKSSLVKVELIKSLINTIYKPFNKLDEPKKQLTNDMISVPLTGDGKPNVLTNIITTRNMTNFTGKIGSNIINQLTSNSTNEIATNDAIVVGRFNEVYGRLNSVNGDNNIVTSENNFIQGSDNIVSSGSNDNFIFGSNNNIAPNVNNSIIFGNNQWLNTSNTVAVNGKFVQLVDEINACIDVVLTHFTDKVENYISASRDSVTEIYTHDLVNYINGGRY